MYTVTIKVNSPEHPNTAHRMSQCNGQEWIF